MIKAFFRVNMVKTKKYKVTFNPSAYIPSSGKTFSDLRSAKRFAGLQLTGSGSPNNVATLYKWSKDKKGGLWKKVGKYRLMVKIVFK